jgi:hypothetical protein
MAGVFIERLFGTVIPLESLTPSLPAMRNDGFTVFLLLRIERAALRPPQFC